MFLPPIATWLDLELDALPLEPLEHPLVLLRRRKACPHRLPRPPRANPTVLRLLDADDRGLRRRVDRVVVHLEPELQRIDVLLLRRQAIQLVHRHQPAPGQRLLRPVPEVALIARVRRDRPPVRPRLMRSEEHTSELQSRLHLVCRLLLEKKKKRNYVNNLDQQYTALNSADILV